MTVRTNLYDWSELNESQRSDLLQRPAASQDPSIRNGARDILEAVRADGDAALVGLTERLDNVTLSDFRVDDAEKAEQG